MTGANASRAQKVRAHRWNPEAIKALKASITASVLTDTTAKGVAFDVGISQTNACKWIRTIGFRLMYVTDDERTHLLARRALAATESTPPDARR